MSIFKFSLLTLCSLCLWSCHSSRPLPAAAAPAYNEPHRPQFHFSPPANWMNDPNGMVFYEGEYHLFYQYYPQATVWGPMHWGHAVSRDLVHWEHLPIALYPDSLGLIFSGSAVVDWKNTSGFGKNGKPPLVAIFTHHNQALEKAGRPDFEYQSIAYSNDRGRTWTKYAGNPVIHNPGVRDFRDTKVIWDEDSRQWVLVLAAADHVKFYGSPDLKKWAHLGNFGETWGAHGGVWECPDLFPVRVEGTNEKKWVLLQSLNPSAPNGGSGTQYFVGQFTGKTFVLDPDFEKKLLPEKSSKAVWLDWGRDNYAGVTWSDVPATDGRRLFMGWMSNWDYAQAVPTQVWRSAMTLPRVLSLKNTPEGLRLHAQPVKELEALRDQPYTVERQQISTALELTGKAGPGPVQAELVLDFEAPVGQRSEINIVLSNSKGEEYRVGYNTITHEFFSDRTKSGQTDFAAPFAVRRHRAKREWGGNTVRLHLFFDRASCELFADEGAVVLTDIFFPTEDYTNLAITVSGAPIQLASGTVWGMKRVWR